jgi:hypothetical protein
VRRIYGLRAALGGQSISTLGGYTEDFYFSLTKSVFYEGTIWEMDVPSFMRITSVEYATLKLFGQWTIVWKALHSEHLETESLCDLVAEEDTIFTKIVTQLEQTPLIAHVKAIVKVSTSGHPDDTPAYVNSLENVCAAMGILIHDQLITEYPFNFCEEAE